MNTSYRRPQTMNSLEDLAQAGLIASDRQARALEPVAEHFAIALTPALANAIGRAPATDPVALQFIPATEELTVLPEELADPIGDQAHSPVPGLIHRYPDRALLTVTHLCAVYCRFCFRREAIGSNVDEPLTSKQLDQALDYIDQTPTLWEIILTGGDPLVLSNRRLQHIIERLAAMPHVRILRIHTRVPVAEPGRIDTALINALNVQGLTSVVVVHANHAQEFGPDARAAIARLADAGITLRSQSVLLKGINNSVAALTELMRTFVELRISPYLLHHPDLAKGTSHFRVSLKEGQALLRSLRGQVSGLCQPEYVIDLPGGFGKVPVSPNYEVDDHTGQKMLTDYNGALHTLPANALPI